MPKQGSEPPSNRTCPKCEHEMFRGQLTDSMEVVHVESLRSLDGSSMRAWIYPNCGHIELQAEAPDELAKRDISDTDPKV